MRPYTGHDGGEAGWNGCGLVEGDILGDLHIRQDNVSQRYRSTIHTFAVFSAGTMQYCWKVALSASLTPKENRRNAVKHGD